MNSINVSNINHELHHLTLMVFNQQQLRHINSIINSSTFDRCFTLGWWQSTSSNIFNYQIVHHQPLNLKPLLILKWWQSTGSNIFNYQFVYHQFLYHQLVNLQPPLHLPRSGRYSISPHLELSAHWRVSKGLRGGGSKGLRERGGEAPTPLKVFLKRSFSSSLPNSTTTHSLSLSRHSYESFLSVHWWEWCGWLVSHTHNCTRGDIDMERERERIRHVITVTLTERPGYHCRRILLPPSHSALRGHPLPSPHGPKGDPLPL